MDLVVDGVYCGACIVAIEKGLGRETGVRGARVNLANKRVTVEWDDGALEPPRILDRLEALGYPAYPFTPGAADTVETQTREAAPALPRRRRLRRDERHAALGLALGRRRQRPEFLTRDLFHWLSALVALPAATYAGMPFFESAGRALRRALGQHGRADLARPSFSRSGMSVLQTLTHQRVAYFDSAVMLVTFLLAGRVLDSRMRRRTRDFAINLSAIRADRAVKL